MNGSSEIRSPVTSDVIIINRTDYGSTGEIAYSIFQYLQKQNVSASFLVLDKRKPLSTQIACSFFENQINRIVTKISGRDGFHSTFFTKRVISFIKKAKPKIVHLHNLHGYYINFPNLFSFLKKENIQVVWTLHDCWAFTGKCPHFDAIGCQKWKTVCGPCPINREYPKSFLFDKTAKMFLQKKELLTSMSNVTYVLISDYMKNRFFQSFLAAKPSKLILDGVDVSFYLGYQKTNIKSAFDADGKKRMLLFVAASWNKQKGLETIFKLKLAIQKEKISAFIVVAGLPSSHPLHDGKLCFCAGPVEHSTLANLYYSADVYINASLQESFGMTVPEALACGTPVVSFDTGAARNIVTKETGVIVPVGDYDTLIKAALSISKKDFSATALIARSLSFSFEKMNLAYFHLFKDLQ